MSEIERIAQVNPEAQLISQVAHPGGEGFKRHQPDHSEEDKPTHDTVEIGGEETEIQEKKPENLENHLDIAA